ncbi:MAG: hypothetical protein ABJE95_20215 [Byssovorax sp.]
MKQGLSALLVLVLWNFFREDTWHAELSFASYDCAQGEVCKLKPGLSISSVAGSGHPYHYTTNQSGFRSPELPPIARDPGVFRLQVYGSSPIFGLGVDDGETFSEVLRRDLEAALPGRRIEVMNFGLPMNYFASEVTTYSAFGRVYEPDLVIFVQPEIERLLDMNSRVIQIQRSPTLTAMLGSSVGRILVNRAQYLSMEMRSQLTKSLSMGRLRVKSQVLLDDQRRRGTRLYFFDLFDTTDDLARALPVGLEYQVSESGMSHSEYLRSAYVIPLDGHPNAEGQRYFAGLLAARLAPLIAAR